MFSQSSEKKDTLQLIASCILKCSWRKKYDSQLISQFVECSRDRVSILFHLLTWNFLNFFKKKKRAKFFHWIICFNWTTGRRSVRQYLPEGQQRSKIHRHRCHSAGCRRNCTRYSRNCDSSQTAWKRRMRATRSLAIGNSPLWWWTGSVYFLRDVAFLFLSKLESKWTVLTVFNMIKTIMHNKSVSW